MLTKKLKNFANFFVTERCFDKVGTDTCKWRVQNGHPCSVGYMKLDCIKTCVCGTLSSISVKFNELLFLSRLSKIPEFFRINSVVL